MQRSRSVSNFLACLLVLCSAQVFAEGPNTAESMDAIRNFHQIDANLRTAGQVLPKHIESVAKADIGLVINLAPASSEHNREEGFLLTEQKISYVHIPVKWDEPTDADLQLFFAVMQAREDRSTLVHCFANYRASAFTYLYRVLVEGVAEPVARKDLEVVWDENAFAEYPQWRGFIDVQLQKLGVSQ